MLGWEFPPIINGGLGVACLGLSKALSQYVDLKVLLPKSDPSFFVDNVELIGLNNIDIEQYKKISTTEKYQEFATSIEEIETNINPYESYRTDTEILTSRTLSRKNSIENRNGFKIENLYGEDVVSKVTEFSQYAAAYAETIDFDVVHCHDWMTFLAGIEIKARTNTPLVLHVHSLEYDRSGPESQGWVYQLERRAMHYADLIIPVSHYTGAIAQNHYDIPSGKVFPVHNGADPVLVYRDKKDFPEKLILFLGRVTGQKGPQYFLDIAAKVIQHVPNVRFVMAGTGDQLKGLIENGAYKNIGTKFHFTGFLNKEKVHKLFSIADVYCMPSVSEPFGLSALEAAQFGIPCVISKQSGVSEVLFGALKADFWDVDKMASHIISLLQNPTLRDSVVKDAFHDLQSCTWEKAADQVKEIYKKVL